VLRKTETWLLADCRGLGEVRWDPGPAVGLERIVQLESGPEMVNAGVDIAQSGS
jgi:hypothetical protein